MHFFLLFWCVCVCGWWCGLFFVFLSSKVTYFFLQLFYSVRIRCICSTLWVNVATIFLLRDNGLCGCLSGIVMQIVIFRGLSSS